MQVSSAVLAGMVWALENPEAGIVEADEMDFRRCLEIQTPYLGPVKGYYTDWTPLTDRPGLFPEDIERRIRGSSGTCWCGELRLSSLSGESHIDARSALPQTYTADPSFLSAQRRAMIVSA